MNIRPDSTSWWRASHTVARLPSISISANKFSGCRLCDPDPVYLPAPPCLHLQIPLLMYWMICFISASVKVSFQPGIASEKPLATPPNLTTLKSASSVVADMSLASLSLRGLIPSPRLLASGPSPSPVSPWQVAQFPMKLSFPASPAHIAFLPGSPFGFDNSAENPVLELPITPKHKKTEIAATRYCFISCSLSWLHDFRPTIQ